MLQSLRHFCVWLIAEPRLCTFFSLYYHLFWSTETIEDEASIPWLKNSQGGRWRNALMQGEIAFPGVNVQAGDIIGRIGEAGPPGHRQGQLHFGIFSATEPSSLIDPDHWELINSGDSRLCKNRLLLNKIDRPRGRQPPDGLLSRRELRNFFKSNPKRQDLHRLVVKHRSEFTPGNWNQLIQAPDFADLSPRRQQRLISQQITPTLWWTPEVAQKTGLPKNGVVYSYHPIGFIVWFNKLMTKLGQVRGVDIAKANLWEGKMAPKNLTVDAESGADMIDEEDYYSGEHSKKLNLEDLVRGYADEKE